MSGGETAGSFPADLRSVQAGVWGELPRHEAVLWQSVRERWTQRVPSFGDYGIAHPSVPQTAAFAPAPQIRYTTPAHWMVLKGRKGVRRGSQQFYDICAQVVQRVEYSGEDFSWGDQRIARAAESAPEGAPQLVTTGNATTWRTIGTSHHLALVIDRLTSQGAP